MEKKNILCPLCANDRTKPVFSSRDYRLECSDDIFNVVKCRDCGFVYVNPRPAKKEISLFYPAQYYPIDSSGEHYLKEVEHICRAKLRKIRKKRGRLLDVGCGRGGFIYYMKQKGWDVTGIEKSTTAPDIFNLGILRGELSYLGLESEYFDVVTFWSSLEHIYNPKEVLKEANRILRKSGQLIIHVPNFRSLACRWVKFDDVPRHANMFTPKTISLMLGQAGFKIRHIYFGSDISEAPSRGFLEIFLRILCGQKPDTVFLNMRSKRFSAGLNNQNIFCRIRRAGFMWSFIKVLDLTVSFIIDRVSMPLGCYGIMTVDAEKE